MGGTLKKAGGERERAGKTNREFRRMTKVGGGGSLSTFRPQFRVAKSREGDIQVLGGKGAKETLSASIGSLFITFVGQWGSVRNGSESDETRKITKASLVIE